MRILLVRLRLIGDVVFTTPAIRAVRRRFPDGHVAYVVEPEAAPVVTGNRHLDDVIVARRGKGLAGLKADIALVKRLRAARYDLAIDFHGGPRSGLLTALCGARTRIGYAIPGRTWCYTQRVERSRDLRPRHSVVNQWDLLAPLGIGAPDPSEDATEMPEQADAAGRVARWLEGVGYGGDPALIVLHVSAGNPFRRWPVAAFTELVVRLLNESPGRWVAVTSGPSDMQAAARVCVDARGQVAPDAARRILHASDLGLADLRSLIGRAALFIGGDSGPMHIAGTTTTPIVALYGPTLRQRSEPWRDPALVSEAVELRDLACRPCDQRECVTGDVRCLAAIPARMVQEAAERAMARQQDRQGVEKST
ncbi:MAG: glycosyltransferase family 9 protein [Bacteroidales bacterium]